MTFEAFWAWGHLGNDLVPATSALVLTISQMWPSCAAHQGQGGAICGDWPTQAATFFSHALRWPQTCSQNTIIGVYPILTPPRAGARRVDARDWSSNVKYGICREKCFLPKCGQYCWCGMDLRVGVVSFGGVLFWNIWICMCFVVFRRFVSSGCCWRILLRENDKLYFFTIIWSENVIPSGGAGGKTTRGVGSWAVVGWGGPLGWILAGQGRRCGGVAAQPSAVRANYRPTTQHIGNENVLPAARCPTIKAVIP